MSAKDATKSLADPALLEIIDKLVELNIGDSVDLPQLLVVGDQSSGKSSVLEGLTNLPFPREMGLCTRFATQIIFRRSPTQTVSVSIIPANSAVPEEAERLRSWKYNKSKNLTRKGFSEILKNVQETMRIGNPSEPGKKTFSDDVLRIEICGPHEQHLSVVDVPGIFRRATEGMTTKADMTAVRTMVERYMENSRSIILGVIPCNSDIATQEILEIAEKHDKKGQRTLGVLTKPDLVDRGSEKGIIDLMEGRSHRLKLGWCMVRNPGQSDLEQGDELDRNAIEKAFFDIKAPWSKLSKDRVGVQALRNRLVEILTEIVRRDFSNVRGDVSKKLKDCKRRLENLGPSRETTEQQLVYLVELATRFQNTTSSALEAHYGDNKIFESIPSLKLATAIVDRNEAFSNDFMRNGHTMYFEGWPARTDEPEDKPLSSRRVKTVPELNDVLHEDEVLENPGTGIMDWLERLFKTSRGFELGTFDAAVVPAMWREQSVKWDDLALGYVSDVVALVHDFTVDLLKTICDDERVTQGLVSLLMGHLTTRYNLAIDHVKFILEVERAGTPLTLNRYFSENLETRRQERIEELLQGKVQSVPGRGDMVTVSDLDLSSSMSNTKHVVQDLHDILESYYDVARQRFVDNICMQAGVFHLVTGPDAPVKVFNPSFVSKLKPEQLERIAGEDLESRRTRAELRREISNLENGRKILI